MGQAKRRLARLAAGRLGAVEISVAFALRFDRLIDHAGSRLDLSDGRSSRRLVPRLNAQPNTLFTAVGKLQSGDYELTWTAKSRDGDILAGSFSFRVK